MCQAIHGLYQIAAGFVLRDTELGIADSSITNMNTNSL